MSEINIDIERKELPVKTSTRLLIGSLLLGVLFNLLFYKELPALSFLVFTLSFYVLYFAMLHKIPKPALNIESLIFVSAVLLAASYAIHSNTVLFLFNLLLVPTLIITHTILVSKKNSYLWHSFLFLSDLFIGTLTALFSNLNKPFLILYSLIMKNPPGNHFIVTKKVLLGLLLSLPILIITISLLTEADAVFNKLIVNFSNVFHRFNMNSLFVQGFIIITITLFAFSYLYSMLSKNKLNGLEKVVNPSKSIPTPFADPIIVLTMLTILCLIYLIFVYIQFAYLFSSINLKLPDELTYAEYARKGFFELIDATLLNVGTIVFSSTLVKTSTKLTTLVLKTSNTILVLFTAVMLFSAHFRMSLYEKVYGYTYLRFFTHYFMIYIVLILCAVLIKIWYNSITFSKYFIVITILVYTTLNYVNVDKILIDNNISHYNKTGKFDVTYMSSLSFDTVPTLLNFYNTTKQQHPYFEKALCQLLLDKKLQLTKWTHIQSFNYSAIRAKHLLKNF